MVLFVISGFRILGLSAVFADLLCPLTLGVCCLLFVVAMTPLLWVSGFYLLWLWRDRFGCCYDVV